MKNPLWKEGEILSFVPYLSKESLIDQNKSLAQEIFWGGVSLTNGEVVIILFSEVR
jgi:hypothetical protein